MVVSTVSDKDTIRYDLNLPGLNNDHDGPLDMTSTSPSSRHDVSGGIGGDSRSDAASPSSNNDNVDVDTIHDDMTGGSLGGLAPDQV